MSACDTGRASERLGASQHTENSFMHIAPSAKRASATVIAIFAITLLASAKSKWPGAFDRHGFHHSGERGARFTFEGQCAQRDWAVAFGERSRCKSRELRFGVYSQSQRARRPTQIVSITSDIAGFRQIAWVNPFPKSVMKLPFIGLSAAAMSLLHSQFWERLARKNNAYYATRHCWSLGQ